MEYSAQHLEYAVSVFYNGEHMERAKAHTWLTAAQRVPEAWNFVWELLQPNKNTEVQFYAATTLHTKILRCWNEVPLESYEELKQKILHAVITYSKGPKIVTNRLCISLAAFILQQGTEDLAGVLRPLSTAENTSLLLEVLTVIPEEYNSMTMGTVLRRKNQAALRQASAMVLDDMLRYLQSVYNDYSGGPPSDETVQVWTTAATCAGSWLTLGGEDSPESAATTLPERAPLCRALYTAVHVLYTWNECVSGCALEACEACLGAVRAAGVAGGAERHRAAALQLLADLAALAAPILAAHNVPNSINEELLSAVITCCVSVSECHARALVEAAQGSAPGDAARALLELLLAAQAAPGHYPLHETRSNLVFGLWYTLQDEILHMTCGEETIHPIWREVFSQLLVTLITKSEAPPEHALSSDDEELLRCYRQDIADTVMYCYSIIGEWCWEVVAGALGGAGEAAGEVSEARREAALHVFHALADAAPYQRAPPGLLRTLHHALHVADTSHNRRMLATALDCLGSYGAWVSSIEDGRNRGTTGEGGKSALGIDGVVGVSGESALGEACVRAAGGALARGGAAAALALRKLCEDCAEPAAALAPDIVRAAQSPEGRSDAWVRRQLISAAGSALSVAEPSVAEPLLLELAISLHDELRSHAEEVRSGGVGGVGGVGAAGGAELASKCAAALMHALAPRPALAAQLLRALLPALALMPRHTALTEPMFLILKQTLSSLMGDCLPMVNEIAQLTVAGFETQPCASGLEVVKLLVMFTFESWGEAGALLRECVASSARAVAGDVRSLPDLVDALFCTLDALTKRKAHHVLIDCIHDLLDDLVQLACSCVKLWEAGAARAACGWLAALAARRASALQPHAPALIAAVLRCIGGATPRNQMEPLAELLFAMNKGAWRDAELATWLRPALAAPGFPSPHASPAHKDAFITKLLKEKTSKVRLLGTVREFSLVCRGLIGTEYARQTMASKQLVA